MSIRIAALLSAAVILTACAEAKSEFVEASKATSQEAVRNEVMESASVSSPDGEINVRVFTEGGLLKYAVSFAGEDAVAPSRLGLRFEEGFGPDANIEIMGIEKSNVDLSWEQPWVSAVLCATRIKNYS